VNKLVIPLWCDCCGDIVIAVYPCKFVFFDGRELNFNICPECMKTGTLKINLPKMNLVSIFLNNITKKEKWKKRGLK